MRGNLLELGTQAILVVLYGAGALLAASVGVIIEYHSVLYFLAGEYHMAAYLAFFGGLSLFFAYLFVKEKLWAALTVAIAESG